MKISIWALTTADPNKSWEWMRFLQEHVENEKNGGPRQNPNKQQLGVKPERKNF